eukprot:COSAG06_NODE_6331_length_2978_cov_343.444290_1_plen_143_part_00
MKNVAAHHPQDREMSSCASIPAFMQPVYKSHARCSVKVLPAVTSVLFIADATTFSIGSRDSGDSFGPHSQPHKQCTAAEAAPASYSSPPDDACSSHLHSTDDEASMASTLPHNAIPFRHPSVCSAIQLDTTLAPTHASIALR